MLWLGFRGLALAGWPVGWLGLASAVLGLWPAWLWWWFGLVPSRLVSRGAFCLVVAGCAAVVASRSRRCVGAAFGRGRLVPGVAVGGSLRFLLAWRPACWLSCGRACWLACLSAWFLRAAACLLSACCLAVLLRALLAFWLGFVFVCLAVLGLSACWLAVLPFCLLSAACGFGSAPCVARSVAWRPARPACPPAMVLTSLRLALTAWVTARPNAVVAAAFLKDILALLELAHPSPKTLRLNASHGPDRLIELSWEVFRFLSDEVLPTLHGVCHKGMMVSSPYAGGVAVSHAQQAMEALAQSRRGTPEFNVGTLNVATFNPGRSGFATIGTDEILYWRLWAVALALLERDVHVCVIPGARLPPGTNLPSDYPYVWHGHQSVSWAGVGFLIRSEVVPAVTPIEEFGGARHLWLAIHGKMSSRGGPAIVMCGVYGAPGGDRETWSSVLSDLYAVRLRWPGAAVFVIGDVNFHIAGYLDHPAQCHCAHCKQSASDRAIEGEVRKAGLVPYNPNVPTHDSGSAIDLVLAPEGAPLVVDVSREVVGASDHRMVLCSVFREVSYRYACGIGRVAWVHQGEWDVALRKVEPVLKALADSIESLVGVPAMAPPSAGGTASRRQRRALLDLAAWVRDVVYVVAGHSANMVRHSSGKPPLRMAAPTMERPESYSDYAAFKQAAAEAIWAQQRAAAAKLLRLRVEDPAEAERYLSCIFRRQEPAAIQLVDPLSGHPLSHSESVELLVQDLWRRAHNDFPEDPAASASLRASVVSIRQGVVARQDFNADPGLYSVSEVNEALGNLKAGKRCAFGCIDALRAPNEAGRRVTLALVNLSRFVGLTSSLWSLRKFYPIRKMGPAVVRHVGHVRPISIGTDMAQIQDALWLMRNRALLEAYAGPAQVGGIAEPISLVLAIVVLAQLRAHYGLPTYLALTDMQWAFDVASVDGMLQGCYRALVLGRDWMLIDDVLAMDRQAVELHGVLSAVFVLGCGTAQGRRFSLHVFNGLLKAYADLLCSAVPGGVAAVPPPFARAALAEAAAIRYPDMTAVSTASHAVLGEVFHQLLDVVCADRAPWHRASAAAAQLLATLVCQCDRAMVMEWLGTVRLGPMQFVDDASTPCPSIGAARAVLGMHQASACSRYATTYKAAFNYKPGKTACIALLDSPPVRPEEVDCECPEVHRVLGIALDSGLTFAPLLTRALAIGRAKFADLHHAAESSGLGPVVTSAQVLTRVEPAVLYGAAFFVLADGATAALNRMQAHWARSILGCPLNVHISWAILVAQCGWEFRLSSRALEAAFVGLARLSVLPLDHPAARVAKAARATPARTWYQSISALLVSVVPGHPIPEIEVCPTLACEVSRSRECGAARKLALRRYRWEVVRPALRRAETAALEKAASRNLPVFGLPFSAFQPYPERMALDLLAMDMGPSTWRWFRMWAMVRMTGRWPLAVLGGHVNPEHLASCALCGCEGPDISHALLDCRLLEQPRAVLDSQVGRLPWADPQCTYTMLFGHRPLPGHRLQHIKFVGLALSRALGTQALQEA